MNFWGYHLILDCKSCEIKKIINKKAILKFCKELVREIEMKAYGKPLAVHFAGHNPNVGGFSLVQLIETSAITGHFVDANGDVYLDIFSCKRFEIKKVIYMVEKHFKPKTIREIFIIRQA